MATVDLTVQQVNDAGVAENQQALTAGNTYRIPAGKAILLHFKNTNAGAAVVTFTRAAVGGQRKSSAKTLNVPATTGDVTAGPYDPNVYVDKANPEKITFTVNNPCTVAALQLPLADERFN